MKEHKYQNFVIASDLFLQVMIGLVIVYIFLLQFPEMKNRKFLKVLKKLFYPFILPLSYLCRFFSLKEELPLFLLLAILIIVEKSLPRMIFSL